MDLRQTLEKVGVTLVDEDKLLVRCNGCGCEWTLNPQIRNPGANRPRWFRCPKGCNASSLSKLGKEF
jgi:hypothetical protein